MSYNEVAVNTWINSPYHHKYRKYKINHITMTVECRDGSPCYLNANNIIDNIHQDLGELTLVKDMPTRFITVLLTFSETSNVTEVFKEWKPEASATGRRSECICSQIISENCIVRNISNGNILVTGNVCIDKFDHSKTLGKSFKQFTSYKKTLEQGRIYKLCSECQKYKVYYESTDINCNECKLIIENILKWKEEQQRLKHHEQKREITGKLISCNQDYNSQNIQKRTTKN